MIAVTILRGKERFHLRRIVRSVNRAAGEGFHEATYPEASFIRGGSAPPVLRFHSRICRVGTSGLDGRRGVQGIALGGNHGKGTSRLSGPCLRCLLYTSDAADD